MQVSGISFDIEGKVTGANAFKIIVSPCFFQMQSLNGLPPWEGLVVMYDA